jgi:hypothetical protein
MTLADSLRARFDHESNRETEKVVYLSCQPWAPEGYLHTIHKPLPTAALMRVANDLDFPASLIRHFMDCNGAKLFSASLACAGLYLFGCWEKGQIHNRGAGDSPPLNIEIPNSGIESDLLIFGSYAADGSYLLIDRKTEDVLCAMGRDISRIRCSWPSLEVWRDREIARLSELFDRGGRCLAQCEDLLPPDQTGRPH